MKEPNKIVKLLINVVLFIVVWTLIDWIYSLIVKQPFAFRVWDNLVYPAIAGVIVGLIDPIGRTKKDKKD